MLLNDAERSEASDCMPSAIVDRRIAAGILFCDRKKLIETHWRRFNVIPRIVRSCAPVASALMSVEPCKAEGFAHLIDEGFEDCTRSSKTKFLASHSLLSLSVIFLKLSANLPVALPRQQKGLKAC